MGGRSMLALLPAHILTDLDGLSGPVAISVLHLLQTANREFDRDAGAAKAVIATAASLLQAQIAEARRRRGRKIVLGGLASWQEVRLKAHIEARFRGTVPIETLAELVNLSVSHFTRVFKQSFGVSPHAYLTRRRLEFACALMLATEKPLAEVAYEAGFTDQAHLCRRFRRAFQTSPGAWRRERGRSARPGPSNLAAKQQRPPAFYRA